MPEAQRARSSEVTVERVFSAITSAAVRRPFRVLLAVVGLSLVFGAFLPRAVNDTAVAVDNDVSRALDVLDETFGDDQVVTQVLVESSAGPMRSADGLRAAQALEAAIEQVAADTLVAGGQPPIVSYVTDVATVVDRAGIPIDELDDATFAALAADAGSQLPPMFTGLIDALVGVPAVTADQPDVGLMLVFQDGAGLDDDEVVAVQELVVAAVDAAVLPAGFDAQAISLGLLLGTADVGPEIGRLFGTALGLIVLVLGVIYWLRPVGTSRASLVRRTAADVGLTFVVILLSVLWMQGIGVLLGPSMLGLIGAFSPQTQIVPILIVGLGVDFAIHWQARYRAEAGASGNPVDAAGRAFGSVGPALLLCTAATAIGFLTNLVSPVDFLATLGVLAAAGIVAAFVLTLTVIPAVRVLLDRRASERNALPTAALASSRERVLPQIIGRTAWLARRVPGWTIAVAIAVTAVGGYGFTQLDTRFELTDFVPQDDPRLAAWETLTQRFNGGFEETTSVLLTGAVGEAEAAGTLDALAASLGDVDGVESFGGTPDVTITVTEDGAIGRMQLRTVAGQAGAAQLGRDISVALAPLSADNVDVVVASPQILQAAIGEDIEASQITSLFVALSAAMLLLAAYFRRAYGFARLGVITVLPVVLVLAATFGTMAITGIPLNAVTATLAALSIGIGVPFTIHITARFLEERAQVDDAGIAVQQTLLSTGGALAGSALTTAIGFGILVTSTLVPFEQLGYVIVYAIAYSFVAAVLVLPSMLVVADRLSPLLARR